MNINEREQLLAVLKQIEDLKIDELIINHFGLKDSNINTEYVLGNFTGQNLIFSIKKIVTNFNNELNLSGWPSLPLSVTHDLNGSQALLPCMQALLSQLNSKTFDGSLSIFVESIINYQRVNNFWHSNEVQIKIERINEIESLIHSKNIAFENALSSFNNTENLSNKLFVSIQQLIDSKNQEIDSITENAEKSTIIANSINEVLSESKAKRDVLLEVASNVNAIAEDAKNRTDEERKKFEDYKKVLDEFQRTLTEKMEAVTKSQEDWTVKLNFATSKESYINAKVEEINNLTGFAAGVSLFHTFQHRKEELKKPVEFWQWAVGVMALVLVAIVMIIFNVNPATTDKGTSWGIFLLNTLKSIPAIILLYFAIRQYNKERAFQEEYAFKSSVALTINAFADKVTTNGDKGKDALIMNSVAKVYETPNTMREKGSIFSFRTKALNEVVKNLTEAVREIRPK